MNKIIIGMLVGIVILISVVGYQLLKPNPQPQFIEGEESLEITILGPDNNPLSNLEVDLWDLTNPKGPPTAGYSTTNNEGKVFFKIPEGDYLIGFNGINFPKEFINPGKTQVTVIKGKNKETIILNLIS